MIGTGAIGTFLLEKINNEQIIPGASVTAILDERIESKQKLEKTSEKYHVKTYQDVDDFLSLPTNLIIECATIEAVQKYATKILSHKDLFLISVGALVDPVLTKELHEMTRKSGRKLYLPSGAIGGLDVLQAANMLDGLESVKLITRKPPHAFSFDQLEEEKTIFKGSAQDAIMNYPKNANIALSLFPWLELE